MKQSCQILVTGGAGFIGSHLTERLLKEHYKVTIIDNFSSGKRKNLHRLIHNPSLVVVQEDLKSPVRLNEIVQECNVIFHLAANPEVRIGETDPRVHFEENILSTFNLLETIRKTKTRKIIIFTSTSTVYGEPSQIPTPENYGPLVPISTYGASKLACEGLITSHSFTFNNRALILRLANIIGPKSNHGVIIDFIRKLVMNPQELEILGDGEQEKSYVYINDCIGAMMHLFNKFHRSSDRIDIFNIGSRDTIRVREIARIVAGEMKVPRIKFRFTVGLEGGRGWRGDVKTMQLCIKKVLETGWKPKYTSEQAVRSATRALLAEKHIYSSNMPKRCAR